MIKEREAWYHLPDKVTPEGKRTLPFSLAEMGAIGRFEQENNTIQFMFKEAGSLWLLCGELIGKVQK